MSNEGVIQTIRDFQEECRESSKLRIADRYAEPSHEVMLRAAEARVELRTATLSASSLLLSSDAQKQMLDEVKRIGNELATATWGGTLGRTLDEDLQMVVDRLIDSLNTETV